MTDLAAVAFLVGRVAFAGVLGFLALGNLLDHAGSVAYAEQKGVPLASLSVPAGSVLLLAGAASVALGFYPLVGAAAVVAFLVPVTLLMHDFWTMEGQRREAELAQFLKNVGLLGAALALGAVAGGWPYAIGGTLT
ncbi:MAG: DoxX family protein [Halobacteriaceae archaeon]